MKKYRSFLWGIEVNEGGSKREERTVTMVVQERGSSEPTPARAERGRQNKREVQFKSSDQFKITAENSSLSDILILAGATL